MAPLKVYNTLARQKEEFVPLEKNKVRIYVCGPTVYEDIHIGNARAFVAFDVIRRYLEYKGYKVTYVSNITDVDDKTVKKMKQTGTSLQQLGEKYSDTYFKDITDLNVKKPDINPRATQHIEEIVNLIQTLVDKGFAYVVDGEVYYDVSKSEGYGKLSGNKAEALKAGARIEVNPHKRNPADFVLWKKTKPKEPSWISPWGKGRPGWHIECSAMSMKYLGETFDIHAGGEDLIFPHHENEIAQSESATGKEFAKYWIHNRWLTVNGEKMSKSLGNFVTARDAIEKYGPQVVRFFLASVHYRSPIDFSDRGLRQAHRNLERLIGSVENLEAINESQRKSISDKSLLKRAEETRRRFEEAMDDDFNTSLATSTLFDLVKEINRFTETHTEMEGSTKRKIVKIVRSMLEDVLGIQVKMYKPESEKIVKDLMDTIFEIRQEARERGDWKTSDEIRRKLKKIGFAVEDTQEGTKWKIKQAKL